jgi:hypothetical protein
MEGASGYHESARIVVTNKIAEQQARRSAILKTSEAAKVRKMEGHTLKIESTEFGSITIEGKTYQFDVVIRLSGEVIKRKKKLSKMHYGTSHKLSKDEAKFVYEIGCDQLILGTGQYDNVRLSQGAADFLERKGCKVLAEPTPDAIDSYNRSRAKKKIGLFHVTC